jgi:hypothetical protein
MAIIAVAYSFLTSEARWHTLHIGMSIGVPGRRVPGPIVLLSALGGRVLMAVRWHSVQFPDIVVIQIQCQFDLDPRSLNPSAPNEALAIMYPSRVARYVGAHDDTQIVSLFQAPCTRTFTPRDSADAVTR